MRDRLLQLAGGAKLAAGAGERAAWLELTADDAVTERAELTEGELLMAIEALAMVYAELVGARPDSVARGVKRTLRNTTAAARERRRASGSSEEAA